MIDYTKHIYTSIFISLICFAIPADVLAQLTDTTGTGSGQRGAPHVYKYDARAVAMGEATVADPTNLSAINMNPAALSFIRDFSVIQLNIFQNWNNNLMVENTTLPVLSSGANRLAAQFGIYHTGLNATNPLGNNPQPEPNISMYQLDVAYAYSFENMLSVGVLNNSTLSQNDDAQYWTNFSTFGLMYSPSQSLSYGLAFRGAGRSVVYNITDEGNTTLGSQNLRESLELGATIHFPVDTDDSYLSLSLANEKRFGENGIWYKMGAEVMAISSIALRSGFLLHPENGVFAPRFGLGFIADGIMLDYSLSFQERMYERFHQLGITINLE
ncbi:MAG: hypothetical protein WD059_13905 [Balneolaceae bacterium]